MSNILFIFSNIQITQYTNINLDKKELYFRIIKFKCIKKLYFKIFIMELLQNRMPVL